MRNVVIACGGTGGHLTPGIALAQSLEEKVSLLALHQSEGGGRQAGQQVSEIILCSHAGFAPDQNPLGLLRFFYGFARSFWSSYRFYKKIGADALVGFGGFSSFGQPWLPG